MNEIESLEVVPLADVIKRVLQEKIAQGLVKNDTGMSVREVEKCVEDLFAQNNVDRRITGVGTVLADNADGKGHNYFRRTRRAVYTIQSPSC